jgi:hypothetical protein
MVRSTLTACLVALSLFAGIAARAQATNAAAPTGPAFEGPNDSVRECVTLGEVGATITVGRPGPRRIKLELEGGGCGEATSPYGLSASGHRAQLDVNNDGCPAFGAQAGKLQPSQQRELRPRGPHRPPATVHAGPFAITDFAGYFELRRPGGRRAAARRIRQTLAAVRPCWAWDATDDDAPRLVHRLYVEIAMTLPQR